MNITVFCGSLTSNQIQFQEASQALGQWLAEQDHQLIYGGSSTGLMGLLADAVLANQGQVTGIVPQVLNNSELNHTHLNKLIEVDTMSQRKEALIQAGQAFIALPGGPGTLEEVADVLAWLRMESGNAPCIIYNINGYYDDLANLLKKMVDVAFIDNTSFQHVYFCQSLTEIAIILAKYSN
ncbi:TIGR00730 family Rossman fold protein [Eremococcus coleocola]|uniref:LOG family protein n=1 Tax=Eremococcus coleocola TaxID=88132 RepID=UPI000402E98B|nr:TIGR00730 family Rossman fold protein [Eremococcus coleocola]